MLNFFCAGHMDMEEPGMGVVEVVHTFERPQQPQHMKLQPRPPHSPDLIQLSDSDSNLPIPPPHDCGYTRITTQEYDAEDINTNDLNKNHKSHSPDRSSYRRPSAHSRKASMNSESFTRDHDSEDLEDFEPKSRRLVHSLRRTTSGSSDPGLSSPGSASSPGSDSATPTNLLPLEDSTALTSSHHRSSHWHRLVNDEHCHLLGTEEDSSDRHSSNEEDRDDEDQLLQNAQEVCEEEPEQSPAASTATLRPDSSAAGQESSCSSVAHGIPLCTSGGGSSSGGAEGIWRISEEQRSYYTQQFRRLQPDLSKVVQGQQAKHFFEKSKLATDQLTRIWHLSDVTQDGALSLPEFLVAMHLVVARRNNVPLPSALPQPLLALLLPSLQQQQQQQQQQHKENAVRRGSSSSGGSSVVSSVPPPSTAAPSLPPSAGELSDKEVASPSRAKEWTKFVDSPTSTVSSPGLKPVNFDFQRSAVEEDPQILHPKAVRVTPEPGRGEADCASGSGAAADGQASTYLDSSFGPTSLPPGGGKMEPPPPPPRPTRTHARSSSLDLNKFQRCGVAQHLGAPPAVPPRTSPGHVSPNKKLVYQRSAGETVTSGDMSCSSSNSAVHYSKLRPALQHQDCVLPASCGDTEHRRLSQQQLAPHMLPPKQSLPSCAGEQSLLPRASAFEVYRKPGADSSVPGAEQAAAPGNREADLLEDVAAPTTNAPVASSSHLSLRAGTASIGTKDKKEVCASIKTTRDRNTVLARLNNELNQELAEVIEERIALEMQLEQMKLFNN